MNTSYIFDTKTYLVLTDSLTELIASAIDSFLISGSSTIIVTSRKEVQKAIAENIGLQSFVVPVLNENDNGLFYQQNMPGSLELEIEKFPLWKGLSIDRLRFWQVNNNLLKEFVSKLDFDTVVIDFDPMSPLSSVWDLLDDIILIKNETLRTPEHFAFLTKNSEKISKVITDKEMDVAYLNGLNSVVWETEKPFEPPIEKVYADRAIYYDKRYIWQFNEFVEKYGYVQPISFDDRSIDLFNRCHPHVRGEILPPSAVVTPSELIMFAYDERVIDAIKPQKVAVFDPYGVNMTKDMIVGDERVGVINV